MAKNMPDRDELKRIWAEVPPDYYYNLNFLQKIWHEWKWIVIRQLAKTNAAHAKNILEVGCAGGHLTGFIAGIYPNAKITGIDVYGKAIREAKKRYPGLNFEVADAHELPFANDTFDLVVCSETIEHLIDPPGALAEIRRVLKPEGVAVIEMDSGSVLFQAVWELWTRIGPGKVWRRAHLHPYKAKELRRIIVAAGFKVRQKVFSHLGMAVTIVGEKISV